MSTALTSGTYPRASLPFFSLSRMARTVWRGLEAYGRARAARHLHMVASQRALSDPELARQIRAAADACRQGR